MKHNSYKFIKEDETQPNNNPPSEQENPDINKYTNQFWNSQLVNSAQHPLDTYNALKKDYDTGGVKALGDKASSMYSELANNPLSRGAMIGAGGLAGLYALYKLKRWLFNS